jgi:ferredoxin
MIVAEQKPIAEIIEMLKGFQKILVLGCGTCVTVCFAGGAKEVEILSSLIRMDRKKSGEGVEIVERTLERQCDPEFIDLVTDRVADCDALLSLACGAGVQMLAERFPDKVVLPGCNTMFLGVTEEFGVWSERCAGCGSCVLDKTAGLCPITRCSKRLFNGPCGGSQNGKCEIDLNVDCVWHLIYDRLKGLNQLEKLEEVLSIKDWSSSVHGGPRKIVREDLKL